MKSKVIIVVAIIALIAVLAFLIVRFAFRTGSIDKNGANANNKEAKVVSDDYENILVLYFSWSGNTQSLAKLISDQVGGDLRLIEPVDAYPESYNATADRAKKEQDDNARPKYKDLQINLDDYDTIFIGYPIWWYSLPMIMDTIFDDYDFSGKTIIPFNTHEGSGNGGTYETIKQLEPNATVLDGLAIRGGDMSKDQEQTVKAWLDGLGFKTK